MTQLAKIAVLVTAISTAGIVQCFAAESPPIAVEIESPLASSHPLQGYLRQTSSAGPSPAVVLLHSCNGNWGRLDQRWGKRIASWGYVTLTVDSLGPRGLKHCGEHPPQDLILDGYRALKFLARHPLVDPARIAVLGFANGGRVALTSVEHGFLEQASPNKFHAAIAFYPPCRHFKGGMTVPTLILIGERDDVTPAEECRKMVDGRDAWGISRQKDQGAPIKLIIYPDAYHGFDVPSVAIPAELSGRHLEFNQIAKDQSVVALREFLDATIGRRE
ncbi:dienelactone hydrolase family protein [Bradyrhizobium sp. AUGA SZCCT0169]|uniref:dienelactone hydrolase family protein n=1 Tax=Bradyrhizobium sp. AUGA SZCCT0169 TaxID=2807663 RepID=UPI001BA71A57|nr:dienelactone hydrolase family protein [Bradyrhizobium sp. AUGA SZCCT0169]MBR1250339.1 dienelactone hydrolase family protein [Bradyrhizobium sp. AUGA SZCCT0169]